MDAHPEWVMRGGMLAYLDACHDMTEAGWLGISEDGEGFGVADFWTIAQVAPGGLRGEGDRMARRWIERYPATTGLECWFRRVIVRLTRQDVAPFEPWVILLAMGHAYAGRTAPSPVDYATKVNMPMASRTYARVVKIARDEMPEDAHAQKPFYCM
jgi:hypothetical protein